MTSKESVELVKVAAASGVVAGVNYNIRYYPLCLEAAARMRAGEIGDLHHLTGSYVQDWLFHPTDFNWRVLAEEGGELRAVSDIGTHWPLLIVDGFDDFTAVQLNIFHLLSQRVGQFMLHLLHSTE